MKTSHYSIDNFLSVATPIEWLLAATHDLPLLLIDHAHCEKKAAATALSFIYRYSDKPLLLTAMSKLAREELRHFEQVLGLIEQMGAVYSPLVPGRYAATLHRFVTHHEPNKLIDSLILGAVIEARSCERFRALVPYLPEWLAKFYQKLHTAEARHFTTYLELAQHFSSKNILTRVEFFTELEAELILQPDDIFRFHSGIPNCYSNSSSSVPSLTTSPS